MTTLCVAGLLGWVVCGETLPPGCEDRVAQTEVHMGTSVTIIVYATDARAANSAIRAAFDEIRNVDAVMSDYRDDSELSRLSRRSPTSEGVSVSVPLWTVLAAAERYSKLSDGAFDVTVGPLSRLWRRARRRKMLPSADRLAEARKAVGYRLLKLDADTRRVELLGSGMRLDLGGIAKGYAADAALAELRRRGLSRAMINAGGDLTLGDPPPDRDGWNVGVAPLAPDEPPSRILCLANCGVATSGDAWQYVELDGRRFSHIVDPRTGLGLTDRSSVSVVAPNGMSADALASTISVLGPVRGLELIERLPKVEAMVVRQVDDQVQTRKSGGFDDLPTAP